MRRRRPSLSSRLFRAPCLWVALAGACSGGSSGGGPPEDVSGSYHVLALVDATDCGEGTSQEQWTATIVQNGANVVVETPFGSFQGTVSGNEISVTGSFADGAGFTTFEAFVFTVAQGVIDGSVQWTYSLDPSGAPVECGGETFLEGERAFEVSGFNYDGATGVPRNAELVLTFTKDVEAASVSSATLRVVGPGGQVPGGYAVAGNMVRFVPDAPGFDALTAHSVNAVGVQASDGEPLFAAVSFDFTTGS